MYETFFGLRKSPFVMTPDPAFLFLTAAHREALAGLTYAILHRKGFVVLTGDAGTGKTTLLSTVLQSVPPSRARFSFILNPTLTTAEFLEMALHDFGVTEIPASKTQRLLKLQQFLLDTHRSGQAAVLVVDEAHKLGPDLLEEIRLLTNFEIPQGKLLQIVLAGQTELGDLLNRDDLRQLKQRVAVRLGISPLSQPEVEQYIRHRWMKAGGVNEVPFHADAIQRIALWSRGVPRLVNAICDNALLLGYGAGARRVDLESVVEVMKDLDLRPPSNGNGKGAPALKEVSTGPLPAAPEPVSVPKPTPLRTQQTYRIRKNPLLKRWVGRLIGASVRGTS